MNRRTFIIKHTISLLVFATISTAVILSWFRYGYLYGGGDVGLPSYDPQRIVEIAKYVWWESAAPGNLVPHGLTVLPVMVFQSLLASLGFPFFVIQAVLFWILLFLMGYGMFWVGLSIFGKDKFFLAIFSGLFYILNPYMMIQVWHRFIHNTFFLAAALPFFYLFWNDWLKNGKFTKLLLFLLANFLTVYLYGTIAYVVTVVFMLSLVFLKQTFIPWQGFNFLKKVGLRFITGFILWILIHAWWMIPTFSIVPTLFSTQHRIGESIVTLITLSRQTIMPYTLSGANPFYLFEHADFGDIYKHPLFLILMWIPLVFLIPGFIISIRSKALAFWGILLLLATLLAKGAASPFGFLYIFAFSQIFALGVLRNPFEKLGILLPFSLAIIYTVGFRWYLERFKEKRLTAINISLGVLLILQLGVFLWPFWTGKLIGNIEKLALVDVPKYYQEADDFISNQNRQGKILHLPLSVGESIAYTWPYNLSGVELSPLFFKSLPSISRALNLGHVDDVINAASNIFRKEEIADEKIIEILQSLNVRFVVLHKDVDWRGGFLDDPQKLEKILDNKIFLEKKQQFGELVIYEILEKYYQPKIYVAPSINFLSTTEKSSFWPYLLLQNNGDFLSDVDNSLVQQKILLPEKSWTYHPKRISFEKAIGELTAPSKILPGSSFYFLIKLKEDFRVFVSLGSDRLKLKLIYAGKRLVEAERLKEKNGNNSIVDVIAAYQKLLLEIIYAGNLKDQIETLGGRSYLDELFSKHLVVLDDLFQKGDEREKAVIQKTKNEYLAGLSVSEVKPYFEEVNSENAEDLEYTVYRFEVPAEDQYELLMADLQTKDIYPDRLEKLQFQVDDKKDERKGINKQSFISYGNIKLDRGKREFIVAATPSANLYKRQDPVELSSTLRDSSFFEAPLEPLTSDTLYTVQFDAWIQKGEGFKLQLIQEQIYEFNKIYTRDDYNNFWNHYRVGILFNHPASTNAWIRFLVEPWNECRIERNREFCLNKTYIPRVEPSTVLFRNIRIERLLNNPIFLRSENKLFQSEIPNAKIEFSRQSPVYYSGKIELDKGGFVIFSEAFHKDWQLKLKSGGKTLIPKERFLANLYANAWFVPEGDYKFELEFTPQKKFYWGMAISGITVAGVVIFYLGKIKKWLKK